METATFRSILSPERGFYALVVIYGVAIGVLTLSIPVSVQLLISTVANTAQIEPLLVLAVALFVMLAFSALFYSLQELALELFERRFFARITSEAILRLMYSRYSELERVNREEMANRYFDIMTVQRNVPVLLTGGVALALQALVGLIVTSFYHPLFLLFNVVVVASIALVGLAFHRGARESAVALSGAKYDVAGWLEQVARMNSFFKARRTIDYALERAEELSARYVHQRKRFFFFTFAQLLGFLALYALASAILLGLGGALVIEGQLTLGQLVAAELILSAIFVGLTRFGYYLRSFYELRAAAEKVAVFFELPLEKVFGRPHGVFDESGLTFRGVRSRYRDVDLSLDAEIPPGSRVLVGATSATLAKHFADLVLRFREPDSGVIELGGADLADLDPQRLRNEVVAIDDSLVLGGTIAEYLSVAGPGTTRGQMRDVLEQVGLDEVVQNLGGGLDEVLTPYGYPLSASEAMRLKLAYALLCAPRVILLSHLFDVVGHDTREFVFRSLGEHAGLTVISFSNRRDVDLFDRFLFFSSSEQRYVPSVTELEELEARFWARPENGRTERRS